jgi:hypothetical protein
MVTLMSRCPAANWAMCGGMPCMIASVMNRRRKSWKVAAQRLAAGGDGSDRGERVAEVFALAGSRRRAGPQAGGGTGTAVASAGWRSARSWRSSRCPAQAPP